MVWPSCSEEDRKLPDIPKSTAREWLHQENERLTGKYRPGRLRVITYKQIDAIKKWFPSYMVGRDRKN